MDGSGQVRSNLLAFSWAPMRHYGEVVAEIGGQNLSPIALPEFLHGHLVPGDDGWDRFGWRQSGESMETEPARLVKLNGASVQRRSLGRDRWHVVLGDGICAQDSYHDGRWLGPHIGETVRIGGESGPSIRASLMDDAPVDVRVKAPAVLIGHFWAENYAHTLLETASRFWFLETNPELADLPVVWDLNRPWQKEIAEILCPGKARSLPANRVMFDNLYVPSFYSQIGSSKASVQWLRRRFKAPASPGKRRILISRADATERRIVNEDDVISLLAPRGFETVMLTGMSVAEQMKLFGEAEAIVAPHGAGLANLIFAGSGTKVIEFVPKSYPHHMFWHIAEWCGHWCGRIVCDDGQNKDMRVDVEVLDRALESAGL